MLALVGEVRTSPVSSCWRVKIVVMLALVGEVKPIVVLVFVGEVGISHVSPRGYIDLVLLAFVGEVRYSPVSSC